ncbi:MAG: Photosystem I reaction center subunit III, partial [Cyanobacteria bacterium J06555_13]
MKKIFSVLLAGMLWLSLTPATLAEPATGNYLVPCKESAAFNERMKAAPQSYYFDAPYQAYAANLLCGEDGLPHQQLRLDKAGDI